MLSTRTILLVLILPVALHVSAQNRCDGVFTGHVRDESHQPVIGAVVLLSPGGLGVACDTSGRFQFNTLCPGNYHVIIQYLGYKEITLDISSNNSVIERTINLIEKVQELNEVVIQGAKEDDRILASQIKTDIQGEDLIKIRGLTLGESLTSVTGVYTLQSGPTIFKPVIHGLHSNRILIFNNGVRQEGQQWGSEHAPEIDPFVATKLSVVKGASSIRYGSDAIGGVILVNPSPLPVMPGVSGEINLAGASNNGMGVVSGIVQGALDKKMAGLSWRMQGTLRRAGNSKTPGYYSENSGFSEVNYSSALSYKKKNYGGELYYSQFNTKLGIFTGTEAGSITDIQAAIQRKEPITPSYFSYTIDRPYQQVKHDLFKANAFIIFPHASRLDIVFARQQNIRSEYDYVPLTARSNPELYLRLISHTLDITYKQRAVNNYSGMIGVSGVTQGNVRHYEVLIPNFRNYGGGVFYSGKWTTDRLTLEAGVRYDYRWLRAYARDNNTAQTITPTWNFNNVTGTIGFQYAFSSALSWTLQVGTAWRTPTINELMSQGVHQSAVAYEIGNPNLHSEYAYNVNSALLFRKERLHAEIGLYENIIDGYIFLKPDLHYIHTVRGAFPEFTYTQVNARFNGIDLSASYRLVDSLTFTTKNSLLFAWNQTIHDYLQLVPANRSENSIRIGLGNPGVLKHLYIGLTSIYVARQRRVPATSDYLAPPPQYMLLNGTLGFSFLMNRHAVTITASVNNILNTVYRDYMDRFRYFMDEPGRNFTLRVRIPFGSLQHNINTY